MGLGKLLGRVITGKDKINDDGEVIETGNKEQHSENGSKNIPQVSFDYSEIGNTEQTIESADFNESVIAKIAKEKGIPVPKSESRAQLIEVSQEDIAANIAKTIEEKNNSKSKETKINFASPQAVVDLNLPNLEAEDNIPILEEKTELPVVNDINSENYSFEIPEEFNQFQSTNNLILSGIANLLNNSSEDELVTESQFDIAANIGKIVHPSENEEVNDAEEEPEDKEVIEEEINFQEPIETTIPAAQPTENTQNVSNEEIIPKEENPAVPGIPKAVTDFLYENNEHLNDEAKATLSVFAGNENDNPFEAVPPDNNPFQLPISEETSTVIDNEATIGSNTIDLLDTPIIEEKSKPELPVDAAVLALKNTHSLDDFFTAYSGLKNNYRNNIDEQVDFDNKTQEIISNKLENEFNNIINEASKLVTPSNKEDYINDEFNKIDNYNKYFSKDKQINIANKKQSIINLLIN
jgi:hypothetical protein